MNVELAEKSLATADLAATAEAPDSRSVVSSEFEDPAMERNDLHASREDG
jgi:hypothetical protein